MKNSKFEVASLNRAEGKKKIGAWMAFDVGSITFCDYASAGNGFSQQNIFRTWLPQPLDLSTVYKTGQTRHTLSHASTWTNPPKPRPQLENRTNDLALAANGATASSDGEYAKESGCTAKVIDGVMATPEDSFQTAGIRRLINRTRTGLKCIWPSQRKLARCGDSLRRSGWLPSQLRGHNMVQRQEISRAQRDGQPRAASLPREIRAGDIRCLSVDGFYFSQSEFSECGANQ
jgi:hypothetical protein